MEAVRGQKHPSEAKNGIDLLKQVFRDHPFKTSACFRGGGVKNLPNLPMDSTKKLPTVGGLGSKKCDNLPTC